MEYGSDILYPVGWLAMVLPLYGFKQHIPSGKHSINNEVIQIYSHQTIDNIRNIINNLGSETIVKIRHGYSWNDGYLR